MKTISKDLQFKIVAYPLTLVLIMAITFNVLELTQLINEKDKDIEDKTSSFIQIQKEIAKSDVLKIDDFIKFQINEAKNSNINTNDIKKMVLNRYDLNKPYDKYFFIYELYNINGGENFATMILNQNRPDLIGETLSDKKTDVEGKEFYKEVLEKLRDKGEAYVEYWYKKPNDTKHYRKLSYFYLQKDFNWIIAKGFYFDSLEPQIQKIKDRLDKKLTNKILLNLGITSLFMLLIGLLSYILSKKIIKLLHYYIIKIESNKVEYTKNIEKQKIEFESIFKYNKDGIAILDLNTNFLDFNDAYLEMTGFTKEELLKKSCMELSAPEYMDSSKKALKEVLEKGYIKDYEKVCVVKDGKRVTINMSVTLMPDKKRILISTKDITSLKMLESQSKLASMGEMIGNIAHQWRQPLSVITTSATGLKFKSEYKLLEDGDIIEFSDLITEQANYLSETIEDFKNFIKENKQFQEVSAASVVKGAINLSNASLKNNYINLVEELEDDIIIYGNKNELKQALINIISNSKDALKDVEEDELRAILLKTKILENNSLELSITDTGGGIPENIIDRIFEPYFTTKHQSVGTGLGLAMTYKILKDRHDFNISVKNVEITYNNETLKGACFTIIFKGEV